MIHDLKFLDLPPLFYRCFSLAMSQSALLRRRGYLHALDSADFPLSAGDFGCDDPRRRGAYEIDYPDRLPDRVTEFTGAS